MSKLSVLIDFAAVFLIWIMAITISALSDADRKYEIRGSPAEEFPSIAILKASPVSLTTNAFREGLKGVLYAISTDETKRILTGVYIQIGQNALKFIATDGH